MPDEEDYLGELNENLGRLKDILDEYDEIDDTLDSAKNAAENIEDIFEEAVSEINELGGRLDMRVAQSRKKDELINEMADRIEELESDELEDLDLDYLLGEIETLLDEYISEIETTKPAYISNYKSPTFNFGLEPSEPSYGNFKSPTFNFGAMPSWGSGGTGRGGGTNILDSWDDYNWEGWKDDGEPEFDTPAEYAESRGVTSSGRSATAGSSWPSIKITYHEEEEDIGAWFGGSEEYFPESSEPDMPWGEAAS